VNVDDMFHQETGLDDADDEDDGDGESFCNLFVLSLRVVDGPGRDSAFIIYPLSRYPL